MISSLQAIKKKNGAEIDAGGQTKDSRILRKLLSDTLVLVVIEIKPI